VTLEEALELERAVDEALSPASLEPV
jgi:hypothetical protein